jgi:hypothetical protein
MIFRTTNSEPLPEVVHQPYAPFTGSQKCKRCGGWIVCDQSFGLNEVFPLCPACFTVETKPKS